jgi:TonB family protein
MYLQRHRIAPSMLVVVAVLAQIAWSDTFSPDNYGVGATLVGKKDSDLIVIRGCFAGGPADRAGIKPGDKVLSLDGVSVKGWSVAQVTDYLIQKKPEPVRITVLRGTEQHSFELVRAKLSDIAKGEGLRYVPVPDSQSYMIVPIDERPTLQVGDALEARGLRDTVCSESELSNYEDRPTFLYFWASWCAPCKKVIAELRKQHETGDIERVRVVGINVDSRCDLFQTANDSLAPPGYQFWAGGWFGDLPQALGIHRRGIPASALMDRQGRLVKVSVGVDSVLAMFLNAWGGPTDVAETKDIDDREGFLTFDNPPVLLASSPPIYPEEAELEKVEGTVVVIVTVSTTGNVEEGEVLKSTNPVFNEAAINSAKSYRFRPGTLNGRAVRCRVAVPVHFTLRAIESSK